MNETTIVGIADMKLAKGGGVLITYALGSCVGICLYDAKVKAAAMIHIMLPSRLEGSKDNNIYKFADTGILDTIKKMESQGAAKVRLSAKIAGGASMFELPKTSSLGDIGLRNVESVKRVLKSEGIPVIYEDVGGNYARTLIFDSFNGQGTIKIYGKKEVVF